MKLSPVSKISLLLLTLLGATACNGLHRVGRKMDIASERLTSGTPVYEGRLTSFRVVGPMVSLQFADGQLFDVSKAPSALVPGDIVRIYKTEKGYEAHLYKASKDQVVPPTPTH